MNDDRRKMWEELIEFADGPCPGEPEAKTPQIELRPCPFCGDLQGCWHLDLSLQNGSPEQWNRRPLEDALRAELEAAKAANKASDVEIMRMQAQVGGMATKLQYADPLGLMERAEKAEQERDHLKGWLGEIRRKVDQAPLFWLNGAMKYGYYDADKNLVKVHQAPEDKIRENGLWWGENDFSVLCDIDDALRGKAFNPDDKFNSLHHEYWQQQPSHPRGLRQEIMRAEAAEARVAELEAKLAESSERNAKLILRRIENEGELAILRGSLRFESQEAMAFAMDDMEGEVEDAVSELHKANARIAELEAHFPRSLRPDNKPGRFSASQSPHGFASIGTEHSLEDCTANPPGEVQHG